MKVYLVLSVCLSILTCTQARSQLKTAELLEQAMLNERALMSGGTDLCLVEPSSGLAARAKNVGSFGLLHEQDKALLSVELPDGDRCILDCKCLASNLSDLRP